MSYVRTGLSIVGGLVSILGIIWIAQGTGVFPYPESSFMINQSPWIWRGALLALVGLAIIWASRRFVR